MAALLLLLQSLAWRCGAALLNWEGSSSWTFTQQHTAELLVLSSIEKLLALFSVRVDLDGFGGSLACALLCRT